ncbi:glycosyltransferase family 2 protein [Chengkuizengella sediminis]|uniref:glycosyltransferase family 2 protein n=1 Tax=Chengkuizengella sediminis TaxID=1885917 RepID=UPI00138A2D32|nr:glycosyltransferase [Chengkuizengella sediminis]NDI36770.1 glycosyltransferase [Chengkuizengella sediminis]
MKASVIMPVYNVRNLLKACLLTFKHQVLEHEDSFEVIVIDDGSTDGTAEVVSSMALNYESKYIYIPRSEHSSRSAARNKGIEAANGDVILFIDGDHLVPPNYINEHLRFHKAYDNFAIIGFRQFLSEGDTQVEKLAEGFSEEMYPPIKKIDERFQIIGQFSENFSNLSFAWYLFWTCNTSVKRNMVEKIGGFDEDFIYWGLEDSEFGYRLYKEGVKFAYSRESIVYHQHHEADEMDKILKWSQNYEIFRNKHSDMEVKMLEIMDIYKNAINKMNTMSWINKFTLLEYAIRAWKKGRTLDNISPTVHHLTGDLEESTIQKILEEAEHKPILIMDHSNEEMLDVRIQMHESKFDIKYYKGKRRV